MSSPGDKVLSHMTRASTAPEGLLSNQAAPATEASVPWAGIAILFAASGCAALIYEVVWFQMLQLLIGSTAVSLGVLLGTFMGGMCLGSLLLPRMISLATSPLRFWAFLELSIGVLGLGVLFVTPWLGRLYGAITPTGFLGIVFRGLLCAVCMLPPTLLMGATFPVMSRLSETDRKGMSQMGLIYGANTLGAMSGALLAGFFLLRVSNVFVATFVAAGINICIGFAALVMRAPSSGPRRLPEVGDETREFPSSHWPVYVTIALSGFCALGAEVIWTRLLSLMLGSTTYSFSIILAVFLLGLGLGSGAGALLGRRSTSAAAALGLCQLLLAATIAWAAFMLARSLPYWPLNPTASKNIWFDFQIDLMRCLWASLPATCLWGASFPLALVAAAEPGQDAGRLVGRVYCANTIGAILGAAGASVFLISWVGTQRAQQFLIFISAAAGLIMLLSRESLGRMGIEGPAAGRLSAAKVLQLLAAGSIAALLALAVPRVPWELIAYGRYLPMKTELGKMLFMAEGMNASVAVTEMESGVRNFHVSGKIEASTDQQDMRLQRMLGHLPALFHPDPRSVLVVGCGAGVTAGSFLVHPGIERINLCEIEPIIPKAVARYFGEENYDVVQNPRVRIIYDDARHYIFTTHEKFDVITSDPIHPWVKGAAALYTKEYFELCKKHLNSGGMVTQWIPLYESDLGTVKSEIATFFDVFPEGTIWSNDDMGEGYDLVLLGQVEPLEVDIGTIQQRLTRPDHRQVVQSLRDVGIRSAFSLAATYAGQAHDLRPWLKNAQINHDRDLRLQYLAGLGLNAQQSDSIYIDLSNYRRFPDEIFVGANLWNDALKRALQQPKSSTKKTGKLPSK
jgi:spermidine synthase